MIIGIAVAIFGVVIAIIVMRNRNTTRINIPGGINVPGGINIPGVSPIAIPPGNVINPGGGVNWNWVNSLVSNVGGLINGTGTLPGNNPITGGGAPAPTNPYPPTPVPNDWAGRVAQLTNVYRQRQGLPPLVWNQQLAQIATNFANDMNRRQFMNHRDPDGRQPWDRARAAGYPTSFVGENLAWGATSPEGAMNQWIGSAGHRMNIMNRQYRQIGVGVILGKVNRWSGRFSNANNVPYWVQLFSN